MALLWIVLWVLALASSADAVTIAVGSDTYLVETFPMPSVVDTAPLPLDIAVSSNNATIYMVPEFDKRIYSVARNATNGTTMTQIEITAPASPLFRTSADVASLFSNQQEKIATTSDGSVWVSQGGNIFYGGTNNDWSRIMRRKADTTWEAYTLPVDSAGAVGFYVTDPPTLLWVMAAGDNSLYFTRLRNWHEGETSPTRYPPSDSRWFKIREFGFGTKWRFPAQVIRMKDKRIAGTLYFDSSFFLYDADTDVFTTVRLTTPPPGAILGSGPWQIAQDASENLWITEDGAQRVTKYNIFTGVQTVYDLSASLSADEHPHSLTFDGTDCFVTTYPIAANGNGRIVKITSGGVVSVGASFATISLEGGLTGIVRTVTGELWVALFRKTAVARLTKQ